MLSGRAGVVKRDGLKRHLSDKRRLMRNEQSRLSHPLA